MLPGDLIVGSGLNRRSLPVRIVDLELNEFHVRMLREEPVQQFREEGFPAREVHAVRRGVLRNEAEFPDGLVSQADCS